jgi:hypothetical protein
MKLILSRVKKGTVIARRLSKSGATPEKIPADGLMVGYEGDKAIYVRLEDISKVLDGDYEVIGVDSWRDDGDEEATEIPDDG